MLKTLIATALIAASFSSAAFAAATVGQAAPDFALTDVNGKTVKLSDFKGKNIVMEWHNRLPVCAKALQQQQHADAAK